jgi:hypothetical protein
LHERLYNELHIKKLFQCEKLYMLIFNPELTLFLAAEMDTLPRLLTANSAG